VRDMIWSLGDLVSLPDLEIEPDTVAYVFVSCTDPSLRVPDELLDAEELDRARRFRRESDRSRFATAHAALRTVLARCLRVEPTEVRYELGSHGKPRLAPRFEPLRFNLSHSGKLGLCAAARGREIGVDLELVRELDDVSSVADDHFSPAERRALRALPPSERNQGFFRCWTRKEALVKALGEGLAYPLESFDVDIAPGSKSALLRYENEPGTRAPLSVRDLHSPPGYAAAGAASRLGGDPRWRTLSEIVGVEPN
jgi:4'-phosphopantetheinyl transferase